MTVNPNLHEPSVFVPSNLPNDCQILHSGLYISQEGDDA